MLDSMQADGLRPNARTFSTLMRGCMRVARGDAALGVLERMRRIDIVPDCACVEYAVKALVYDGNMKAASKLCKLHARDLSAAAAVVLATGWTIARRVKKAVKAVGRAKLILAPGSDPSLNPFKKNEASGSHEMYSLHQAKELQRDLDRISAEIERIDKDGCSEDVCKSMRKASRVLFLSDSSGSSSTALSRDTIKSRFAPHLEHAPLCVEAGSGYGEWVVRCLIPLTSTFDIASQRGCQCRCTRHRSSLTSGG
jgi:pentatricopeptide repeat protein